MGNPPLAFQPCWGCEVVRSFPSCWDVVPMASNITAYSTESKEKGNQFWYILPSTSTDQIPNATSESPISHLPAVATISAVSPDLYRWPWLFLQLNSNRASPLLTALQLHCNEVITWPKTVTQHIGASNFRFRGCVELGFIPDFWSWTWRNWATKDQQKTRKRKRANQAQPFSSVTGWLGFVHLTWKSSSGSFCQRKVCY